MKKQKAKPAVTPPTSNKDPSLPTFTALGILTAATALAAGCGSPTAGKMTDPVEREVQLPLGGALVEPPEAEKTIPPEECLDGDIAIPIATRGEIPAPKM